MALAGKIAFHKDSNGVLIAVALSGAWRSNPPPLSLGTNELARITPRLIESGEAGLVWRRFRISGLSHVVAHTELPQAARLAALEVAHHERVLERAVLLLRGGGIDPILLKGSAVGRLYPESHLRYYCDVDLLVPPAEFQRAQLMLRDLGACKRVWHQRSRHSATLKLAGASRCAIDLHHRIPDFHCNSDDEIWRRTRSESVGAVQVRVLGFEDQMRLICLHPLRHGFRRPIWLCDIGAALEALPQNFDADYFWHGPPWQRKAILCSLTLARELLDANVDEARLSCPRWRVPRWCARSIRREWNRPLRPATTSLSTVTRGTWMSSFRTIRARWRNSLEVTSRYRLPYAGLPHLPVQFLDYVCRASRFVWDVSFGKGR